MPMRCQGILENSDINVPFQILLLRYRKSRLVSKICELTLRIPFIIVHQKRHNHQRHQKNNYVNPCLAQQQIANCPGLQPSALHLQFDQQCHKPGSQEPLITVLQFFIDLILYTEEKLRWTDTFSYCLSNTLFFFINRS